MNQGHHTFCYGAPNSLLEILWLLFRRVEDISVYTKGNDKLMEETGEIIRYDIDGED
jgi:hypothetical protein